MNPFIIGCYLFSILNLVLFAALLWIRQSHSLQSRVFIFYLLLQGVFLSCNLIVYAQLIKPFYYTFVILPICLAGPIAYLYCMLVFESASELGKHIFRHFIFSLLFAGALMAGNVAIVAFSWNETISLLRGDGIPDLFRFIIFIHQAAYHLISWIKLRNERRSDSTESYLWIQDFFSKILIFLCIFFVLHVTRVAFAGFTKIGTSVISPLLLTVAYLVILKKCIFYPPVIPKGSADEKKMLVLDKPDVQKNSKAELTDEFIELEKRLISKLKNEKTFINKELSLYTLADSIGTSPKQLSMLINGCYKMNFNDFINKYRVEESIKMMRDSSTQNLKLEAIADAAGFNSRASFFAIFKRVTGHTPAAFRKEVSMSAQG